MGKYCCVVYQKKSLGLWSLSSALPRQGGVKLPARNAFGIADAGGERPQPNIGGRLKVLLA